MGALISKVVDYVEDKTEEIMAKQEEREKEYDNQRNESELLNTLLRF